MKVGDLVCLSKYGMERDYNNPITLVDPHQVGLVIEVAHTATYPYSVKWVKGVIGKSMGHGRRELKHVR